MVPIEHISYKNKNIIKPSLEDWQDIMNKIVFSFDNKGFNGKLIKMFIHHYLSEFGTETAKTIAVLELFAPPQRTGEWWPKIIYFPNGYSLVNGVLNPANPDDNSIYVYYRTFHCFDCGLDLDAFCFDGDAYLLHDQELKEAYERWNYPTIRCPNCNGDVKNPGLIELGRV